MLFSSRPDFNAGLNPGGFHDELMIHDVMISEIGVELEWRFALLPSMNILEMRRSFAEGDSSLTTHEAIRFSYS